MVAKTLSTTPEHPPGFELVHTLRGHKSFVTELAWSPDGSSLASAAGDKTVVLWDTVAGKLRQTLEGHIGGVQSVAWSPDGKRLATGGDDQQLKIWKPGADQALSTIETSGYVWAVAWSPDGEILASGLNHGTCNLRLWNAHTGVLSRDLEGHSKVVWNIAWAPDGQTLASVAAEQTVRLWDSRAGKSLRVLRGHTGGVDSLAWSPDSRTLATGSHDHTIRLWDTRTGGQLAVLEGHSHYVYGLVFSRDGRLLVSLSADNSIRLWGGDDWQPLATLQATTAGVKGGLAFHPTEPLLATRDENDRVIHIWRLDFEVILGATAETDSRRYRNAKVVLVGDTGVGKSGLGMVLAGKEWEPTESTHGRHVWTMRTEDVDLEGGRQETRETLLWDMAGQPGYRLIHRLHLHDVAVAMVVFDARSETDPFAGVDYWARALDQATAGFPTVKLLVAARADRGGPKASDQRIAEVVERLGFAAYFETSAKRGVGMPELRRALEERLPWADLPFVVTPELFARIKTFLIATKEEGRALVGRDDLLAEYRQAEEAAADTETAFRTCLGMLEASGLLRHLTFGDLLLLQPEMLDNYCASLALAARAEPDGLGYFHEARALAGDFPLEEELRIRDRAMEPSMLLATIQEAVGRGIAVRQQTQKGVMIVFPSELRRDIPEYPGGRALSLAFTFDGPVGAVFATLTVSLIHSLTFEREELYRNAALFHGPGGEVSGYAVSYPDRYNDARGRLEVFFDGHERGTRLLFLRFIDLQLQRLALEGSTARERIYQCPRDRYQIPPELVTQRKELGETTVICGLCGGHIPMDDLAEETAREAAEVARMDVEVDEERARAGRRTVLARREELRQFHTFLCHNSKDKPLVRQLWDRLRHEGVLAWIDEEGVLGGQRVVPALEEALEDVPSAVVAIGAQKKLGRWQKLEYEALLHRYVEDRAERGRGLRLIPVLLPGAPSRPELPLFLRGFNIIDFRRGMDDRDAVRQLVRSILTED